MKKSFIIILAILATLLVFVSCNNSVDDMFNPQPTPAPKDAVWQVGSDKFATLQEAVDSFKAPKAKDIYSDPDYEIVLLKSTTGPGAVINGLDITINFNGNGFEFTGDYGLKVTDGSDVVLINNSDKIITFNNKTTENLKLIEVSGVSEGDEPDYSSVLIEGYSNLSVEDNQYVICAKNGASITVGSEDSSRVKLSGIIGSRNEDDGATPVVTISGQTSVNPSGIDILAYNTATARIVFGTAYQGDGQTGRVFIKGISNYVIGNSIIEVASTNAETIILDEDCTSKEYFPRPAAVPTGNVVVEGCGIEYVLNGGELAADGVNYYYLKNGTGTDLPSGATRSSSDIVFKLHDETVYDKFEGWYDNPLFEGSAVSEVPNPLVGGNRTFYAKWTPAYKVTLKTMGGTVAGYEAGDVVTSYVYGVGKTLPIAGTESGQISFTGANFDGWYTSDKFEGTAVDTIGTEVEGDQTFYAKWTFSVTFNLNGGSGGEMDPEVFTIGVPKKLNKNMFNPKTACTFSRWATTPTAGTDTVYYEDEEEVTFLSPVSNLHAYWVKPNYVGRVVKSLASGAEKYITPVFYSQRIEDDPADTSTAYKVSYNFYYYNSVSNDFVKFYSVKAKDIVYGNGDTGRVAPTAKSTAYLINEAFQAAMADAEYTDGVVNSTVVYYDVVDDKNQYKTNKDAYAAFYMYIPADSGVNVYYEGETAKSAGSSFSKTHYEGKLPLKPGSTTEYYAGIPRDLVSDVTVTVPDPPTSAVAYANQPTDWVRLSWNSTIRVQATNRITNGAIGQEKFRTGRFNVETLDNWLENSNVTNEVKALYYPLSGWTAWTLVKLANEYGKNKNAYDGYYSDWFFPSFGEVQQMRLSFGDVDAGNSSAKPYFGRAVFGSTYYGYTLTNYLLTSSTGDYLNSPIHGDYYGTAVNFSADNNLDWEISHRPQAIFNTDAVVLVRTF